VETALNALPTVSAEGITVKVTGGPGDITGSTPYKVSFVSSPEKGKDVEQLKTTKTGLSGGNGGPLAEVET
jgi:hypothetical protein